MIVHDFYEHVGLPHIGKQTLADCQNIGSRNCHMVKEKRLWAVVSDYVSDEEKDTTEGETLSHWPVYQAHACWSEHLFQVD
jgi:hypothetical protein